MGGIHLTIAKLPVVGQHKVRAFDVRKGLRGKVCLRKDITAKDIKKKLGLDIVDLDEMGIFLNSQKPHINITAFKNKVSENPGILARITLREGEARTEENLINAFIGSIGKEEKVLESHLIRAARKHLPCSKEQLALLTSVAQEAFAGSPGKLRWFIEFAAIEILPDAIKQRESFRRQAFNILGLDFDPAEECIRHPERLDARTAYRMNAYDKLGLPFDPKLDFIF